MSKETAVSDIERAEHLNYADSKGVKRVSVFNDGVQINSATEETLAKGTNWFVNVTLGNIPGYEDSAMAGHCATIGNTIKTVWENGGSLTYLSADTQLYASSTDAADNQVLAVIGLDANYNKVTRLVFLNGQNQVALSGLMFRVFSTFNVSSGSIPAGDVYIAETDSLTGGVPNTESKIKDKMIAGRGQSATGVFTVPAGKTLYFYDLMALVSKAKDARVYICFRAEGAQFITSPPFEIFQTATPNLAPNGFILPEKTDVEFRADSSDVDSRVTISAKLLLVDN